MIKSLLLSLGVIAGAGTVHAQYLDSSFATYGIANTAFAATSAECSTVVIQPDKKIIAGGVITSLNGFMEFGLTRYDSLGVFDNTFGTAGMVVTPNGGTNNLLKKIALQTDGKILAVGTARTAPFSPWSTMLVRYNTNGTLDNTFNLTGIVTTQVGTKCDAYDVLVQPNGKILICGTQYDDNFYILIRYNADGSPDNTFGTNGIMQATEFGTGMAMALQADGKIVVTGEFWGTMTMGGPHIGVARHNTDGTLDNTFGTNGTTIIQSLYPGEYIWGAHDIKILPNGKILVPIYLNSPQHAHEPCIVRFDSTGMQDFGFGGGDGYATGSFCNFYEGGEQLAIQPDGKIMLAGYITANTAQDRDSLFVMRFDSTGGIDNTFGVAGRLTAQTDTGGTRVGTIALQSNGRFIVGGSNKAFATKQFSVRRYRYAPPPIPISVKGVTTLTDIKVYPNPAADVLHIQLGKEKNASVTVTDMTGKIIIEQQISTTENAINVKTLPAGQYLLSITIVGKTNNLLFEKL